jgi:histidinol-phosphate aminotransferase
MTADASRGPLLALLHRAESVEAYPSEPSDEDLAHAIGLPVTAIARFDMNTLGGGPLPGVVAAHRGFDPQQALEYGDLAYRRLRQAIGSYVGIPARRVIIGAGADELIRLVTRTVAGDGDAVVIPTPTFAMFDVEARLIGARAMAVPRGDLRDRQPIEELRRGIDAERARLVWICTPNNPTADLLPVAEIESLADGLQAVVAVDEVYLEFAEAALRTQPRALSAAPLTDRLPNVVVLRSLAKAFGLAGARIGYLIVPDWLADRFEAARLPLPVGAHSEALALGALADVDAARTRHREIVAERARLATELAALGWEVLPSVTNFVLTRPPHAGRIAAALLERGLVVRAYPHGPLARWLRITALARAQNDRLLAALTEIGTA